MLFVGSIEPINRYQRRVFICDTDSDDVIEITYGEDVSDDFIRSMAPGLVKKQKKRK
jgi:hypothetical protein